MKEQILAEIKRLAEQNGGRPPGQIAFTKETGIPEAQWRGVFWARWSDALSEAGLSPNTWQGRFDSNDVLNSMIRACRHYGRLPTVAELQLYRRIDPAALNAKTIAAHFPTRAALVTALAQRATEDAAFGDLAAMLPLLPSTTPSFPSASAKEGLVYLIKSGEHYKIGRSDELERRVKEIRIALPEAATLVHTITTDDPPGIEAYWHRRFADRRANGEWFRLTPSEVAAFRRRKFQ